MPAGANRRDLANELAGAIGGRMHEGWHLDSEPSAHRDIEVFLHLTPAFEVTDRDGAPFVRIVDDVTIMADLDRSAPSPEGWWRVLSDDARFLRILDGLLAPLGPVENAARAAAERLRLTLEDKGDALRFHDSSGASVALVAGVPSERSRVAECISPPLVDGPTSWFATVSDVANAMGCTVPAEGATHFHYDAGPFRSPGVFQRLVWAFGEDYEAIRERFNTNLHCRRIGPLDPKLVEAVTDIGESDVWDEVAEKCRATGTLTKFADVNVLNLVAENPTIDTLEFRMLPATLDPARFADLHVGVEALVDHLLGG